MAIYAALALGLAGSLHCVGMCGPLLLALPLDAAGRWHVFRQMAVYHAGRVLTYAALGTLFGLVGKGLAIAGLQKALSIGAGAFMIAMAFFAWRFEHLVTALPGLGALTQRLKRDMGTLLRGSPNSSLFTLGFLNGLLPCGMVYAALAGAIASVGGAEGGLFMLLFGIGTLPLLFSVSLAGNALSGAVRRKWRVFQPILLCIAGLLLLQRGLHLDLSLFESAVPKVGADCH